jgi:hypothetical protein
MKAARKSYVDIKRRNTEVQKRVYINLIKCKRIETKNRMNSDIRLLFVNRLFDVDHTSPPEASILIAVE